MTKAELANALSERSEAIIASLKRLEDNHGVMLDPSSGEVWIAHPFCSTPTLFYVQGVQHGWWAPCVWCAMGVVALVDQDVVIKTRIGGDGECCEIKIDEDGIHPRGLMAHFPISPRR
ncbi:MAG: organomercurial lyase, partial [Myxococcota bacterium]